MNAAMMPRMRSSISKAAEDSSISRHSPVSSPASSSLTSAAEPHLAACAGSNPPASSVLHPPRSNNAESRAGIIRQTADDRHRPVSRGSLVRAAKTSIISTHDG